MAEDLYEEGFGIEIRGSECDCNQGTHLYSVTIGLISTLSIISAPGDL